MITTNTLTTGLAAKIECAQDQDVYSYPEYNHAGYGVWNDHYPFSKAEPRVIERRGGMKGSNSVLARMLDTNQAIVILSNNSRFNPDSFGDITNLREELIIELGRASR